MKKIMIAAVAALIGGMAFFMISKNSDGVRRCCAGCEEKAPCFARFDARAKAGEKLTVCFFGGSLTWSANATEPNRTGFRGLMADYFTKKYPKAHFTFVDASIGGTGSNLGIFRLDRDVLKYKPDIVFLDFICNDGGGDTLLPNTCCYEYLIRTMIEKGIIVQQMYFTFRDWAKKLDEYETVHPRLIPYRKLIDAYKTGVGDVYKDSSLLADLKSGKKTLVEIWPIDGGHPDDIGYAYFAEAGIKGYERAVKEGVVCCVPEKPVFGTVTDVRRLRLVDGTMPEGWKRAKTYRTSLWYDGLSSRWMEDVAAFSGDKSSPIEVKAPGNFIGFFGEADEKAIKFNLLADGKKVTEFNAYHRAGKGRLFIWRYIALDDWADGVSKEKTFTLDPIPDAKGELHIESVCTATLKLADGVKVQEKTAGDDKALQKLDHARGTKK